MAMTKLEITIEHGGADIERIVRYLKGTLEHTSLVQNVEVKVAPARCPCGSEAPIGQHQCWP